MEQWIGSVHSKMAWRTHFFSIWRLSRFGKELFIYIYFFFYSFYLTLIMLAANIIWTEHNKYLQITCWNLSAKMSHTVTSNAHMWTISHNMHDDLMHALLQLRAETLQQCIQTALLSLSRSVTELKAINPPRVSALNCWKAKPMCFSQRKLCVEWHDGLINVKDWACVEGNYSELACCFVLADADGWLKVVLTA